jgi:hypothetical protein
MTSHTNFIDFANTETGKLFAKKYPTIMVYIDGTIEFDQMSTLDRTSIRRSRSSYEIPTSWSVIDRKDLESISVIYDDDYRTTKNTKNECELKSRKLFFNLNRSRFNLKASRFANKIDKMYTNCIVGDCAFVFDDSESESYINELLKLLESIEG